MSDMSDRGEVARRALAATGLTRRVGNRTIVSSVDIQLRPGESVALIGPSGCGKTTLLQILGLLDRPDAGVVELDGHDAWSLTENERARHRLDRIGFVFQHHGLFESMTALENVLLPAWKKTGNRGEATKRAAERLEALGLAKVVKTRAVELSGGEAQRVALARALVNDPAIVLADEPTGMLDSAASETVLESLFAVCERGAALLVVTHDMDVASLAARRISMRDGSLLDETA